MTLLCVTPLLHRWRLPHGWIYRWLSAVDEAPLSPFFYVKASAQRWGCEHLGAL